MGDVISSSTYAGQQLSKELKSLVNHTNSALKNKTLSPFTITLGDEFQGITQSLDSAIETLFFFEEECLRKAYNFKLHYVLHYGEIETEINPKIAYEMLGPGLTNARTMLSSKKRERKRFRIDIENQKTCEQLNKLFEVLDAIIQAWKHRDYFLILDMINIDNNQEVGEKHGKTREQIWKRRKTLMINEYNLLKSIIFNCVR